VTGLGEFQPIRRLFTLGSFIKNYRSSKHFGATYFSGKRYALTMYCKKWNGLHFGRFSQKLIRSTWSERSPKSCFHIRSAFRVARLGEKSLCFGHLGENYIQSSLYFWATPFNG
jgi:hypothetical protein